jgi:hypothetical protein
LFFFFEKSPPKLKVVLEYFLSSGQNILFGVFFCLQDKTVYSHFGGFFLKFETFFGIAQKNKNFLKNKNKS